MTKPARWWHKYTITCAVCNKTVEKSNKQQTCSRTCRDVLRGQKKLSVAPVAICQGCYEMKPLPHRVGDEWVCSKHCQSIYRGRLDYGKYHRRADYRYTRLPEHRSCLQCEAQFSPARHNSTFCSIRCRDRWRYHAQRRPAYVSRAACVAACSLCGILSAEIITPQELGPIWCGGAGQVPSRSHHPAFAWRIQRSGQPPLGVLVLQLRAQEP